MELTFREYPRKSGSVMAAKVEELTEVPGCEGNLRAHAGDYVVQDGVKTVQTWTEKDGPGTKDVPYYAVIDGSTFEAEHDAPVEAPAKKGKKADAE